MDNDKAVETAITFLKNECGFACGDPNSDISKAWAEIESLRQRVEARGAARQAPGIDGCVGGLLIDRTPFTPRLNDTRSRAPSY